MVTAKTSASHRSIWDDGVTWLVSGLAVLSLLSPATGAEPPALTELEVKAGFIYNFAKFVEWPATAFSKADAPVVIGVLGEDAFGSQVEQTLKGKVIQGRPCAVKKYKELPEVNLCHVLFIGSSEKRRLVEVLAALKGAPVLTVSDLDRFAHGGGVIYLYKEQNSLRFEVNVSAAERAHLKINPRLLQLARIVRDPKP